MTSYNENAWALLESWLGRASPAPSQAAWIPQPEPCRSLSAVLRQLDPKALEIEQSFKPFYDALNCAGARSRADLEHRYSLVLFVPTRQKIESLGLLAQGLLNLAEGGQMLFACANKQGADGFVRQLKTVALDLVVHSKSKCKWAVVAQAQVKDRATLERWLLEAGPTRIEGTSFVSIPGIYGWNRVDKGSTLLVGTLPKLSGTGADFGAGYGFLSHAVLTESADVKDLHLLEADRRALDCARRNLSPWSTRCHHHWVDITRSEELANLPAFDWIVMNPPFHEGRVADPAHGNAFIEAASSKLKSGGTLFMVANVKLPYEETLAKRFKSVRCVLAADGFKVLHAER